MDRLFSFFDRRITIRISIGVSIVLIMLTYIVWDAYWIARVGYAAIHWHTHLAPYICVGVLGFTFCRVVYAYSPSARIGSYFLLFASILFSLSLAEVFLALSGHYKTVSEKINGTYDSHYIPHDKTHYHLWPCCQPHWLIKPEFSYWRPTNAGGFADTGWHISRVPGIKRILALGDSFTEGDGAPFDSSYVALMRRALGDSIEVLNGGICGSDPFYNFIILRDKLLAYRPDMIIQSVSSNDMVDDIQIRGGLSRFLPDGTVRYLPAPRWEPIYAVSYLSRIFFHMAGYNEVLVREQMSRAVSDRIDHDVQNLLTQYTALCEKNNIQLVIVLHPERQEIKDNNYEYDFSTIIHTLKGKKNVHVVDLLPAYSAYITHHHTSPDDYFWQYDGHHNSSGYAMMAEATLQNIDSFLSSHR